MAAEGDLRKKLKARVEAYGGEIRAVAWIGRNHAPDVLVFHNEGPCVAPTWVETKAPKKGPTRGQAAEHERMRASGCHVIVISTEEQLDAWLAPR